MHESTSYTVIGGFLGAGKTTLLNNLLPAISDRQLAILVNDFGEINIDAELIAAHDGETIKLANGCICCSLAHGFANALAALDRQATSFDQIIVEASGVSDPLRVAELGVSAGLTLDGIIVVVDAAQLCTLVENVYVGELVLNQLQGADLLILNKIDLVTPPQLDAARAQLRNAVPETPVLETSQGQVSPDLLFGVAAHAAGQGVASANNRLRATTGHQEHGAIYDTWSFTADGPVSKAEIASWAEKLPHGVLRAKGLLYLEDDPRRAYLLQLVGKRWQLTQGEPWGERTPSSRLLVIGLPHAPDGDGALAVPPPF